MPEGLTKLIIVGAIGFFLCSALVGWAYGG
jgi:hypothetical protein